MMLLQNCCSSMFIWMNSNYLCCWAGRPKINKYTSGCTDMRGRAAAYQLGWKSTRVRVNCTQGTSALEHHILQWQMAINDTSPFVDLNRIKKNDIWCDVISHFSTVEEVVYRCILQTHPMQAYRTDPRARQSTTENSSENNPGATIILGGDFNAPGIN